MWLQYLRAAGHFNPRSLAGATEFHNIPPLKNYYFNPRSLAGATDLYWPTFAFLGISIHAPSRERPYIDELTRDFSTISIHAPSRERLLIVHSGVTALQFQSTLPHGSDASSLDAQMDALRFQSTLPCGSDINMSYNGVYPAYFNPRSLAGATRACCFSSGVRRISIHAPLRERL